MANTLNCIQERGDGTGVGLTPALQFHSPNLPDAGEAGHRPAPHSLALGKSRLCEDPFSPSEGQAAHHSPLHSLMSVSDTVTHEMGAIHWLSQNPLV